MPCSLDEVITHSFREANEEIDAENQLSGGVAGSAPDMPDTLKFRNIQLAVLSLRQAAWELYPHDVLRLDAPVSSPCNLASRYASAGYTHTRSHRYCTQQAAGVGTGVEGKVNEAKMKSLAKSPTYIEKEACKIQ